MLGIKVYIYDNFADTPISDHCEASNEFSALEIDWKFYSVPPDYSLSTFLPLRGFVILIMVLIKSKDLSEHLR